MPTHHGRRGRARSLPNAPAPDVRDRARPGAKKIDRRVARTKQALHEALIAEMQVQGYDRVTVQHLLDRANVGRTTFYAHFDGKEALLDHGFAQLASWLRERIAEAPGGDPLAFSRPMFEHAIEHRALYRAIVGRRGAGIVQPRIRRVLVSIVREQLALHTARRDVPIDALVEHVVGSYVALLGWFFDHRTGLGPAEMDAVFRGLVAPGLRA